MKFLILWIIHCYWKLNPKNLRRNCIYRKSCSNHVFEITFENGFIAGLQSLKSRYRTCRVGYTWVFNKNKDSIELQLVDGTVLSHDMIAHHLLNESQVIKNNLIEKIKPQ